MFVPIVVLVAILPGLYALRAWDLTPPGPWWGLRGLAVLDGHWLDQAGPIGAELESDSWAYRVVALQPPLYAWLEALGLALSHNRAPLATVLPSYLAGVLVILLVFLHGRLWQGPALGALAAILTGFNRDLLVQMQQASPTTLGLVGLLSTLLSYGQFLRQEQGNRLGWTLLGGFGLGLTLMAVGPIGLLIIPLILLHRAILGPDSWPERRRNRSSRRFGRLWARPGVLAALGALILGLALASPWYLMMWDRHGLDFLMALTTPTHPREPNEGGLLSRLALLAPGCLALGLLGAFRSGRRLLLQDGDDPLTVGGAFWVTWLAWAALVPACLPGSGSGPILDLFLLVPLNLLAAQTMIDLSSRRIPARALVWLAPATALAVAWWASPELRQAFKGLASGQGPDASTGLGLHLGFDLIVVLAILTRILDRWARRRDDRRRLVLGGFLGAVMALTVISGICEVRFRHQETTDLLSLREAILRREAIEPFTMLVIVGPGPSWPGQDGEAVGVATLPGGRLRFLLRDTLPDLRPIRLTKIDELLKLPEAHRLVILAGSDERLSYGLQSRLGLEAIHPGRSGVLDAYATSTDRSSPREARGLGNSPVRLE